MFRRSFITGLAALTIASRGVGAAERGRCRKCDHNDQCRGDLVCRGGRCGARKFWCYDRFWKCRHGKFTCTINASGRYSAQCSNGDPAIPACGD